MAYKRQIAYLDLIENGLRKGNAGFCKWEQKNREHILSVAINGLMGKTHESLGVYTKAGTCLGNIDLRNGRADAVYHLEENGSDWNRELSLIQIPLSQGRELAAEFLMSEEESVINRQPGEQSKIVKAVDVEEKPVAEVREVPKAELIQEIKEVPKAEQIQEIKEVPKAEQIQEVKEVPKAKETQEVTSPKSLWEEFAGTNEMMRPFGTEVEYYKIALEDIYRLKEECHKLRNNQFLLHGYYNYRYLILGKKDGQEKGYWLGVPGIYHEREKMAARMYGFEKFEGARTDYKVGDLGYYLISAR